MVGTGGSDSGGGTTSSTLGDCSGRPRGGTEARAGCGCTGAGGGVGADFSCGLCV